MHVHREGIFSTALLKWVYAIKTISHWFSKAVEHVLPLYSPAALLKSLGMITQGASLDCVTLMTKGVGVTELRGI